MGGVGLGRVSLLVYSFVDFIVGKTCTVVGFSDFKNRLLGLKKKVHQ